GLAGVFLQNQLAWIVILASIFLIGLSRVFLGVHFPSDVLAGWWIGALFLFAVLTLYRGRRGIGRKSSPLLATLRFLLIGSLLLLAGFAILAILDRAGWQVPEIWIENAGTAFPHLDPINPLRLEEIAIASGAYVGFAAGGWWLNHARRYSSQGSTWQRFLRYLIGMAGMAILYLVTRAALPEASSEVLAVLHFVQFVLIGIWISALAPVVFMRLGLAEESGLTNK
ncbi:MAG TPA: phosphatase PAP2 family protein, partial [Anaerolineales bacterium]|nr:phosphatase PAP2 family protein [Anaerolineales bacterium]